MGLFDKNATVESLEELNKKWADCWKCPLRIGGMKVAPGIGSSHAKVIIVGQSPTMSESRTGVMMQDRGGVEIRRWFGDIAPYWGLNESDLYFTNCCKCPAVIRQDFNKPLPFLVDGEPQQEVVPARACGMYLEDEIRLLQPRLIIALGQKALVRFANADVSHKIPKQLDKARKRLMTYKGYKFVAVSMPIKIDDDNTIIDEDEAFLKDVFKLRNTRWQPRTDDVKVKSMVETFHEVDTCTRCELSESSSCRVFGTGNTKATLAFVGEAPGMHEHLSGMPFVGDSGQLLNQLLESFLIHRNDVYICNAVKCWPGQGNPTPTIEHIKACSSHLQNQLKTIKPKVIITLGAIALQAVTKLAPRVGAVRGTKQKCWFLKDSVVIPTWHPAYAVRDIQKKNNNKANSPIWGDLLKDFSLAIHLLK